MPSFSFDRVQEEEDSRGHRGFLPLLLVVGGRFEGARARPLFPTRRPVCLKICVRESDDSHKPKAAPSEATK